MIERSRCTYNPLDVTRLSNALPHYHASKETEIRQTSPAVKSINISLCGEIMTLGTLIEDPCRIIFRLGPNSETPPGGRHLEFQYGRHIAHTFCL